MAKGRPRLDAEVTEQVQMLDIYMKSVARQEFMLTGFWIEGLGS